MIWHLNYNIYKDYYADYFDRHRDRSHWKENKHEGKLYEVGTLRHLFKVDEVADPIIKDLNLEGLNIIPRFRYSYPGFGQDNHLDIEQVIGINFNIYDEPIHLIMEGETHYYEAAVLDVGKYWHSIPAVDHPRLIFKLTIRAPIDEVLRRIDETGYLLSR